MPSAAMAWEISLISSSSSIAQSFLASSPSAISTIAAFSAPRVAREIDACVRRFLGLASGATLDLVRAFMGYSALLSQPRMICDRFIRMLLDDFGHLFHGGLHARGPDLRDVDAGFGFAVRAVGRRAAAGATEGRRRAAAPEAWRTRGAGRTRAAAHQAADQRAQHEEDERQRSDQRGDDLDDAHQVDVAEVEHAGLGACAGRRGRAGELHVDDFHDVAALLVEADGRAHQRGDALHLFFAARRVGRRRAVFAGRRSRHRRRPRRRAGASGRLRSLRCAWCARFRS